MAYVFGEAIKELPIPGGRVDIVARRDGAFQFHEQIALAGPDAGKWSPGFMSGLYDTAEAAEAAARQKFKL